MVSTRRSTANAVHSIVGIRTPEVTQSISDTICVLTPRSKKINKGTEIPANPGTLPRAALPDNISENDLSLTSPITDEDLNKATIETPGTKPSSPSLPARSSSSALRRQVPKLLVSMSGSCHNPIILNEDSSPPRPRMQPPKRKHTHRGLPEPHRFMDNGYRDLYNYGVTRPTLSAMPANGGTFTGHRSHDIYRMMNAKMAMVQEFSTNAIGGRSMVNGPLGIPHPPSVEMLAQQHIRPSFPSPHVQYYQYQATPVQCRVIPSQTEEMLRMKAAQYIRELPRFSSHKRRLSGADLKGISGDEAEPVIAHIDLSRSCSTPRSSVGPPSTPQPNLDVNRLIENTSLITSLLQVYPYSTDQKGLREEISMMVSAQTQQMAEWMSSESHDLHKRRRVNRQDAANLDAELGPSTALSNRALDEKDRELRQAFSASADMWRDGTGHGVADVFAVRRDLSPVGKICDQGD